MTLPGGLHGYAESAQHTFGMVAGGRGFHDLCLPLRIQAGKQNSALQLCGRNRQGVFNAVQRRAGMHRQGAIVAVYALNLRAHFTQRGHHAAHRALLDGCVARQACFKTLSG